MIKNNSGLSAEEITDTVLKDITGFIGDSENIDDQTLLIIKTG